MKRRGLHKWFSALLLMGAVLCSSGRAGAQVTLSVVYDNSPYKEGLTADWGFGCLVKIGGLRILFDTGRDGRILLDNFRKLGERPEAVDVVVISHEHQDHTGGLPALLKVNPRAKVLVCDPTPEILAVCKAANAAVIATEIPWKLFRGVYVTGALGTGPKEQALFIDTRAGLIVIAGCSHPGALRIVERVNSLLPKPILLFMGGFHATPATPEGLQQTAVRLRSLGVKGLAPCHCTDGAAKAVFRALFGRDYLRVGVGRTVRFPFELGN